jgi:predicted dehydrogenase
MTKPLSRRRFLNMAAASGVWIASGAGRASASPSEKLNIAGIGLGGQGNSDLDQLKSQNIVALCDADERALNKTAAKFPGAAKHRDFRKMLESQKDIEAVLVATPDHLHAPAAALALRLGKHVYCEKPLTHSVHEARILRALAASNPRLATQMGTQGHSYDSLRRVVGLVKAGVLGAVREAHAWSDRPIWPQGIDRPTKVQEIPAALDWDLWLGPAPERPYNSAYHPFKWRGWWDFGTMALGDMGIHNMDPIFWALNLGAPEWVEAEGPPPHPESGPAWTTMRFSFPAREGFPALKLTWYDGIRSQGAKDGGPAPNLPSLDLVPGVERLPKNGTIWIGEKGVLLTHDWAAQKYEFLPREKFEDVERTPISVPMSPKGHYLDWVDAAKGSAPAGMSSFDYATRLTEFVLLGNVAYRAGKPIRWDAVEGRILECPEAEPFLRQEYRAGWSL